MKNLWKAAWIIPAAVAITVSTATSSVAGTLTYATEVESYKQGLFNYTNSNKINQRTQTDSALGSPEKGGNLDQISDFLSLGLEGEAVFSFGTGFSGEVKIWETTWGEKSSQSSYWEEVDIYVGKTQNEWFKLGNIQNIADGAYDPSDTGAQKNGQLDGGASLFTTDLFGEEVFNFVKVVDVTPENEWKSDRDGFDINAIAVEGVSVPEPASTLGLMAVAVFGVGSRVKKRQNKA
jgi:hypothetical protein